MFFCPEESRAVSKIVLHGLKVYLLSKIFLLPLLGGKILVVPNVSNIFYSQFIHVNGPYFSILW
jgi:hypothetical protein